MHAIYFIIAAVKSGSGLFIQKREGIFMRIGFIQYAVSKNRAENIRKARRFSAGMDAEIILLPELADCGYLFDGREQLWEAARTLGENEFIGELKGVSAKKGCAVVAGVAEREGEKLYNSAVILDRGVLVGVYRKMHLTDYEKGIFDRGETNAVFPAQGIKLGVQICFDLWFPEISRVQLLQGADLFCVLANFGGETTYDIAGTRAVENLTPLILCNRVGEERSAKDEAVFLGRSTVVDGEGRHVIRGRDHVETAESCAIALTGRKANAICGDFLPEIRRHSFS